MSPGIFKASVFFEWTNLTQTDRESREKNKEES